MGSETVISSKRRALSEYELAIGITFVVVAVAMLADYFLFNKIGMTSNVVILLCAGVVALRVSAKNYLVAVWAPVLAWHAALFTVGQLTRPETGSFVTQQMFLVLYGIANHALWILGATLLALIIVLIRKSKKS